MHINKKTIFNYNYLNFKFLSLKFISSIQPKDNNNKDNVTLELFKLTYEKNNCMTKGSWLKIPTLGPLKHALVGCCRGQVTNK